MGTSLTGLTPATTYDALIKVGDNGPLSGTLKLLSDGLGNDSALALSTSVTAIRGGNQLRLYRTDNAIYGSIDYISAIGFKFDDANSDGYTFAQGVNTPMRITSAGNVGIGTNTPGGVLEVVGGSASTNSIVIGRDDNGTIASRHSILFNVDRNNDIGGRVVEFRYGGNGYTGGTAIARFTQNGLCFGNDTAAANALDDYEEGTWTMGVSFGGGTTGITYGSNTGTYTKIGRQVTVNGYLDLTSKGSSTGNATITGLPFTIPNNNQNYSAVSLWFNAITFANQFIANGIINTTTISLQESTELGVNSPITDADFANNSAVIISFTYFV